MEQIFSEVMSAENDWHQYQ